MQCHLRDQRSQALTCGFWPFFLHAEVSLDSLNLLMIVCIVGGEILAVLLYETMLLNCWIICPCSFSPNGEPCPIFVCERLSKDAPSIPNHDSITCYQFTSLHVECLKQVFFKHSITVPTCWEHVAGIKFRMTIFMKNNKVYQYEHLISCLCTLFN